MTVRELLEVIDDNMAVGVWPNGYDWNNSRFLLYNTDWKLYDRLDKFDRYKKNRTEPNKIHKALDKYEMLSREPESIDELLDMTVQRVTQGFTANRFDIIVNEISYICGKAAYEEFVEQNS